MFLYLVGAAILKCASDSTHFGILWHYASLGEDNRELGLLLPVLVLVFFGCVGFCSSKERFSCRLHHIAGKESRQWILHKGESVIVIVNPGAE